MGEEEKQELRLEVEEAADIDQHSSPGGSCGTISINSSLMGDSADGVASPDLMEDATSPTSSCSSSSSSSPSVKGPLYELSELMAQLPIKRSLSKYYMGKSQSFTALANVKSIEDLVKKENPCRKRMKLSNSCGGGLDGHKFRTPKATIKKKSSSRSSFLLTMARNDLIHSYVQPPIHVQK
ncbi:hypothetical protein Nepgr_018355 [Nepenthes gracilis]|uniref:Oxidative stress 3 n=1 Tax=Nepenthes gracilis TaxID=150966 RepID=A0AAD3XTY3_NEPGR|nr:hypothetical protein Nepgr_018355 [Nepenthes gracilis]